MRISNPGGHSNLQFGSGGAFVANGLASGIQRIIRGQPTPATAKAIELSFRPLLPLILAGSGLLYNQGREKMKGPGEENNAWLRVLGESSVAYLVLANTSGLYPLFGIALAAYRAGKEQNGLGQVKALVNTAVTLSMGYAGVNLFKMMAKVDGRIDDEMLLKAMSAKDKPTKDQELIQSWLKKLSAHDDENVRGLGNSLKALGGELQKNANNLNSAKQGKTDAVMEASQAITARLKNLKSEVFERFTQIEKPALQVLEGDANRRIAKNLMSNIRYSQSGFVKGLRMINPALGYIIAGLMAGTPLAGLINRSIESRYPGLQDKKLNKSILPSENRIWGGQTGYNWEKAIKDPNAEINVGPTMVKTKNNEPAIWWPGMNNNQPIQ
ncbi:hypothetical protein [Vampirovibrio sp.]|uniref:hypothetical protein n=1 Tax=Vampirovibrio sp. TaxID=2717857 RepID=UPI0035940FFD